ncbi:plastocyanin/azurin family copper-binding protein [Bradyrhizobium sp.]
MAATPVEMRTDNGNHRFNPADVHVKSGDQIVWNNIEPAGGPQHTATADDGTFDTGRINPGKSSTPVTITGDAGTVIPYTCLVHPIHMKGTVTIDP